MSIEIDFMSASQQQCLRLSSKINDKDFPKYKAAELAKSFPSNIDERENLLWRLQIHRRKWER